MNSYLTILALALGVGTYTGCSGDDTDTGDDDDDDDDTTTDDETTPTGDTAPEGPEFLEITSIYMYAGWGFDGASIVDMTLPDAGGTMPNAIILTFATDFWNGYLDDVEEYCQIIIPLTNATLAEWAQEEDRLIYGIDWNPEDAATTDCHDDTEHLPVDPDQWTDDMAADWTEGVEWGAAIGDWSDELQEAVEDVTTGDTTADFQADGLLGGRLLIDAAFAGGPELDEVYAHGYKADGANVIEVDENDYFVPYTYDEVIGTGTMPAGYYRIDTLYSWVFTR